MSRCRPIVAVLALALLAGCVSVDTLPVPRLRVEHEDGTSTLYYNGDSLPLSRGEAIKVEVIPPDQSDSSDCECTGDRGSCKCTDEMWRLKAKDDTVVGVVPHWEAWLWVMYGKADGTSDIEVAGARFTVRVED